MPTQAEFFKLGGSSDQVEFNLDYLSYAARSLDVSGSESSLTGLWVNPAQTRAYFSGSGGDAVYQIDMATAGQIDSGTISRSLSVNAQASNPGALCFSDDESIMYVAGGGNIYQFNIGTPGQIDTGSYASKSLADAADGIDISPDGSKLILADSVSDTISFHTLSTPFDLDTASLDGATGALFGASTNLNGLSFSPDGLRAFVTDGTNRVVYVKEFSSPFDYSTAKASWKGIYIGDITGSITDVEVSDDGLTMYITSTSTPDTIYQFQFSE